MTSGQADENFLLLFSSNPEQGWLFFFRWELALAIVTGGIADSILLQVMHSASLKYSPLIDGKNDVSLQEYPQITVYLLHITSVDAK